MKGRRNLRIAVAVVLGCSVLGLTACGGSDSGDSDNAADRSADDAAIAVRVDAISNAVLTGDPVQFCKSFDPAGVKSRFKTIDKCSDTLKPYVSKASSAANRRGVTFEIDSITYQGENKAEAVFKDDLGQTQMVRGGDDWYVEVPTGPIGG